MTRALVALALAGLYLGALGSLKAADLVLGLLVGAWLSYLTVKGAPRLGARAAVRRAFFVPWLFVGIVIEIMRGSSNMFLVALGLRDWRQQGIIEVPMGERTAVGVTVSAIVVGLSPGSLVVDLDHHARVLTIHVIDASKPDSVKQQIESFYQRFQARAFP